MSRCEDFPCCGHEMGCCPRFDPETGEQLDMVCVCGARLPVTRRVSICDGCLRDPYDPYDDEPYYDEDDYPGPSYCDGCQEVTNKVGPYAECENCV